MNDEKLAALRARYAGSGGADAEDPDFRKAASLQFSEGDRRKWPFAGPATFLDAPFRPEAEKNGFADLDVALVGVPMDLGVTNRAGARHGPRAVRAVERVGPYEHVLRQTPMLDARVADVGDVPFRSRFDLASCHADIEEFFAKIVAARTIPLAVGGDHSITRAILAAVGRERPVGLVHFDAHCDTGGVYEGCKFHHGGPFRQAVLEGTLDPERTIQIGIRGGAEYLWEFSKVSGMTVIHIEEFLEMGVAAVIEKARAVVGAGPTYVSFDVDGLDPAFAPGTGTPEVGGMEPREVLAILRGLADIDFVGGDVMEVAPQYDATNITAQIGAQVLFELLCLATRTLARRA